MTETTGALPAVADTAVARRTAVNTVFSAMAQVGGKVATLAWTLVAARKLGPDGFGVFSVALSLALIVSALSEWGFDAALVRRVSRDIDNRDRYLTESLTWEAAVAAALFAVTGAVAGPLIRGRDAAAALALVLLSVFLDTMTDTMRAAASALQRQGATSAALIAQRVLTAVAAVGWLLAGGGLVGLCAALAIGSGLGAALHAEALSRVGFRLRPSTLSAAGLRAFVTGTWMVGVSAIVLAALFRVDALMLAGFKGTDAVGTYASAYKLFDTSLFAVFALSGALMPLLNERGDDAPSVARAMRTGMAVIAAVYLPFAAVCLVDGRALLQLLFGSPYAASAATALKWLGPAPLLFGVAYLAGAAVYATGRTRGMLVAAIVATVVNVAGDLAAIPALGSAGAALMTTVAYAVQGLVCVAYFRRGVPDALDRWRFLLAPVAAAAVMAGVEVAVPGPFEAGVAAGLAVYAALWFVVLRAAQPDELLGLRALLRRR